MLEYELHDNGWVVICNQDIKTLSDDEIKEVGHLVCSNMVVLFPRQELTTDDEQRICGVIGELQIMGPQLRVGNEAKGIGKVGKGGLFGHDYDLDWHANQPSFPERKPLIWLYGEKGTVGSKTSWINNIMAYEAMDEDFKDEIAELEVLCGYKRGSFSDFEYFKEHVNEDNPLPLVRTNEEGKTGLFFPFLQIFGMKNVGPAYFEDLMDRLKEHVLKPEFCYDHEWQDGDVVISEQWLSIHKRWAFDKMDQRVLHRIAFDHSKLYKEGE